MSSRKERAMGEGSSRRLHATFIGKTEALLLGQVATWKLQNLAIMAIVTTIRHWGNDDKYEINHFHSHIPEGWRMTPHLFG